MNRDKEHLQLLAIFHYVVAGLAALFSFFPLLYTTVGAIFIFAARHGTAKPGEDLPPEFDEVVDRLEAGQSPEEIESAVPDLGNTESSDDD